MNTFNEADHPRATGKFTDKAQGAPEVTLPSNRSITRSVVADIQDMFPRAAKVEVLWEAGVAPRIVRVLDMDSHVVSSGQAVLESFDDELAGLTLQVTQLSAWAKVGDSMYVLSIPELPPLPRPVDGFGD